MDDVEIIQQKMLKIRNRKKQKNNYTNIPLLPTIYDQEPYTDIIDKDHSSIHPNLQIKPIPPPELISLYTPYTDKGKEENRDTDKDKEKKENREKDKEKKKEYLLSIYKYWFPTKEGATGAPEPPPFDMTNMSFWNLPCNFLSMQFYTDLINGFLEAQADYSKDPDDSNKKKDRAIVQSLIDQFLMILLAFIMTFNVYYFIFMYRWDCRHWGYVPGHGMYFGKKANDMIDFFLRDSRKPVFLCRLIYTAMYPMLFKLLGVRKYKRISFLFIFLFMLCFVFITSKHLGLSAHAFIVSGKIEPLVMAIVLFSAFTGIFFTSQADEQAALNKGLEVKEGCDGKTVSDEVDDFGFKQNIEKVNGRPYFYSIREKNEYYNKFKGGLPDLPVVPGLPSAAGLPPIPGMPKIPGLDPKTINMFALMAFGKFKTVIMAIIRIIIAMVTLPIAQIFVSCFFLYTTSGIGLIIEEGGLFTAFRRIKSHMNDNDGEDDKTGEQNPFYKEVNSTPFFKFWINEMFLTTIYAIYAVVKFATVPTQVSKLEVKITTSIIIGTISAMLVIRGWLLHRRHCNMDATKCLFTKQETTTNTTLQNNENKIETTNTINKNKTSNNENITPNNENITNKDKFNIGDTKINDSLTLLGEQKLNLNDVYKNIMNNNQLNIQLENEDKFSEKDIKKFPKEQIANISKIINNYYLVFKELKSISTPEVQATGPQAGPQARQSTGGSDELSIDEINIGFESGSGHQNQKQIQKYIDLISELLRIEEQKTIQYQDPDLIEKLNILSSSLSELYKYMELLYNATNEKIIAVNDLVDKGYKIMITNDRVMKLVIPIENKFEINEFLSKNLNFKLENNDKVILKNKDDIEIPIGSIRLPPPQNTTNSFVMDKNLAIGQYVTPINAALSSIVNVYVNEKITEQLGTYMGKAKKVKSVFGLERTNFSDTFDKIKKNRLSQFNPLKKKQI
jgi:hypothetical protein